MPVLVHIADDKHSARIRRSGIAAGEVSGVVYFMPVLQDHFVSHQWLRELKRRGARVLVGVYFRLSSKEMVWAGRYNVPHKQTPLGAAIREVSSLSDPLGYEMFVERKVEAGEIIKVRHLPQKVGWRYMPHAHGRQPCGCPVCVPRGSYGGRVIRAKYDPMPAAKSYATIKKVIAESSDIDEMIDCLWALRNKRRIADPAFLERVLNLDNAEFQEALARTLGYFRHKNAERMLRVLCASNAVDVRDTAREIVRRLYTGQSVTRSTLTLK